MKKYVLVSEDNTSLSAKLYSIGFSVIPFRNNPNVDKKIANHADLSFFVTDKEIFIAREMEYLCEKLKSAGYNVKIIESALGASYPQDVKLNCATFGEYFLCNVDTVDKCVLNCMRKKNKTIINVKQGYTKCSVIPVTDNAVITDDVLIAEKCQQKGIDVLKVSKGNVLLQGFDYGFIGGTAGVIDNFVVFNGDVDCHPDSEKIVGFVAEHKKEVVSLTSGQLVDIGSLIFLTED